MSLHYSSGSKLKKENEGKKKSYTIPSRNFSSPGRKKPPAQQASKAKNFRNQNLEGRKENMINAARNQGTQC